MIKISIFYPTQDGSRFDMHYYLNSHMPMAIECLKSHPGYRGVSVDSGLKDPIPGASLPFVAMCHFLFDRLEDFMEAFTPNASALQGDIPNYTDIAPVIQFSTVKIYE